MKSIISLHHNDIVDFLLYCDKIYTPNFFIPTNLMAFLNTVLEPPSYGWTDEDGNLAKPTNAIILKEFFSRLNVFRDKKKLAFFFELVFSTRINTIPVFVHIQVFQHSRFDSCICVQHDYHGYARNYMAPQVLHT